MKKIIRIILCSFACTAYAPAIEEPPQVQEILEYWFGPLQTVEIYPKDKTIIWFNGGDAIDNDIRNRFERLVKAAANHELDCWKETPKGRLALIILVDQFTRNIYRGTPQAFAYDTIAQKLTLEGLSLGHDQALFPVERAFFYLPLEHAENIEIQKLSVEKFHSILSDVPKDQISHFTSFEHYARGHYATIEKFGRFPYRNKILGRESTPEEVEFLKNW